MTTLSIAELDKADLVALDPALAQIAVLPTGPKGAEGWSPVYAAVADGARIALQLTDWVGSLGTKPAVGSFIGPSGPVEDIEDAVDFRGLIGLTGDKGWSPLYGISSHGARRVVRITDWTGGQGTKPASGQYIGATGLVADIADGIDIRGATGFDGWTAIEAVVSDGERRVRRITDWVGGTGTKPATGAYLGASGHVADIADATDVRGPLPEAAGKSSGYIFFMRG